MYFTRPVSRGFDLPRVPTDVGSTRGLLIQTVCIRLKRALASIAVQGGQPVDMEFKSTWPNHSLSDVTRAAESSSGDLLPRPANEFHHDP